MQLFAPEQVALHNTEQDIWVLSQNLTFIVFIPRQKDGQSHTLST